jgi:ABC-type nitrate/sulfonate/bicarbonate transport system permease component
MTGFRKFNWVGWLVFTALLVFCECGSRMTPKLQLYIPPPSQVLVALGQLISAGEVFGHLLVTLRRFIEGYVLAAALAVTLGVLFGYFRFAHSLVDVLIEFLRPMPSVAIIPVAVLLLGIGDSMIIAVTVYASVWPILINTIDGVRHVEQTLVQTGRTFGLTPGRILRRVILPASLPYIVTGLRVSLSIALILVTTAEMVAGSKGIGFFILDEERSLRGSNMYAGIVFVAVVGYTLNRVFLMVEKRALKWRRSAVIDEMI